MNISATQVLFQLNLSSVVGRSSACRTAARLAPQTVQNFTSSTWLELHRGQIITNSSVQFDQNTTTNISMFYITRPIASSRATFVSKPSDQCDTSHEN